MYSTFPEDFHNHYRALHQSDTISLTLKTDRNPDRTRCRQLAILTSMPGGLAHVAGGQQPGAWGTPGTVYRVSGMMSGSASLSTCTGFACPMAFARSLLSWCAVSASLTARKEGEKIWASSPYLFVSESCRGMPESQSTPPAGGSRAQNRRRDQGTTRNWALSCYLTNAGRGLSRNLFPRKIQPLAVSQPENQKHSLLP